MVMHMKILILNVKNLSSNMLTNYNISKYCFKYVMVLMISVYAYNTAANFVNQKSDVANLVGSLIFAGLFLSLVLILKSDVTKLVKIVKENKNKENE